MGAKGAADDNKSPTQPKILNFNPAMKYRPMGNTGILVSAISLGGLVMAESVHRYAIEHGVNLVHVAWDYLGGQSIKTLGAGLKSLRDRFYLALKDDYPSIDEALKVLNTDHVDFLMFNRHFPFSASDAKIAETFEKLKNQGKVRFAGLTTHAMVKSTIAAALQTGYYNVVMPVLNQPNLEAMTEELRLAEQRGVGVMGMKTMKGLKGIDSEVAYLKKLLSNPAVTTVTKGIGSFDMFDAYLAALKEPLTAAEDRALYRYAQSNRSSNCMLCDECKQACPLGVEISTVLRCKDYYYDQMKDEETALRTYREIPLDRVGRHDCRLCKKCEAACPNGIAIVERLMQARAVLSAGSIG
ncbi:MAG: aldo/keto reductase [Terriglobia bacterium]|jgi:predicted aldo/keto reductase-like oxidoreductase